MSEQKLDKSKPLSVEEMTEAADIFMERYKIVAERMGPLSKPSDVLAVMESVAKLGHSLRGKKEEEARLERFGFNK
tara:strand:+ start:352 stop:579 length:228 start_codon:yes stop_codon:yes gene_type:complete